MILKSSRVLAHQSSAIATYFGAAGDNERVLWLSGDAADIELMGVVARLSGKLFGVRHMVIFPEQNLTRPELSNVLNEIVREYQIPRASSAQACLVKRQKERAGVSGCDIHYHLALPELDLTSGRVLSSRFTKVRDEKLARLLELKLHHRPIVGCFNKTVYEWLENKWPTSCDAITAAAWHSNERPHR